MVEAREDNTSWCEEELGGVKLGDKRLNTRLVEVAAKLAAQPTASINQACEDWADAKAAYRLFDNDKVQAKKIMQPHQERTQERMRSQAVVLAVQDTTLLDYSQHPKTKGVGPLGTKKQKLSGLVMHSTLALTPEGLPLGVLTEEIWARSEEDAGLSKAERKKRRQNGNRPRHSVRPFLSKCRPRAPAGIVRGIPRQKRVRQAVGAERCRSCRGGHGGSSVCASSY